MEEQEPSPPQEDEELEVARRFSSEMLEQVVRGRVTNVGMNDVLKIFRKHYGGWVPESMPSSWYKLRKLACDGRVPKYTLRDMCPKCDWLFVGRAQDPICGRCKTATRWVPKKPGTPARQSVYFDLEDTLKAAFSVEVMADELVRFDAREVSSVGVRDRQLDEGWDGSFLQSHILRAFDDNKERHGDDEGDEGGEVGEDAADGENPSSDSEVNEEPDSDRSESNGSGQEVQLAFVPYLR